MLLLIVFLAGLIWAAPGWGAPAWAAPVSGQGLDSQSAGGCGPFRLGQGCTVFYAADDTLALGGNNEDYWNPLTKVWFLPAANGKHGRMYFGFDDYNPQGGMNDQGIFFDGLAVSNITVPSEGKPVYNNGPLIDKAMADCSTVACVLDIFDTYDRSGTWNGQLLVGDSTGDAAIIEPLAVIRKSDWYLLATNFYQSQTKPEDAACWRFKKATEMFQAADGPSVDLFRAILDAVHQEGEAHTLYSNIYDLKQRTVYLYLFHDFEHVVTLNLDEELAKGEHVYDLPSLFPTNEVFETWAEPRRERLTARIDRQSAQDIDPALYAGYVGRYEVPAALGMPFPYVIVSSRDDKLYIGLPDDYGQPRELHPQSDTQFFYTTWENVGGFELTFVTDASGQATQMLYKTAGNPEVPLNRME